MIVPVTSPTASSELVIIVSVTVSMFFLLVLVLFAVMFVTVLVRTRRRTKGEDISHFIDEVSTSTSSVMIGAYKNLTNLSILTVQCQNFVFLEIFHPCSVTQVAAN